MGLPINVNSKPDKQRNFRLEVFISGEWYYAGLYQSYSEAKEQEKLRKDYYKTITDSKITALTY